MQLLLHIKHHVNYGQAVYVAHNLNNWSLKDSIKLTWAKDDHWIGSIEVSEHFQYKYYIASFDSGEKNVIWEKGENRQSKSNRQRIDYWEQRDITLVLKDQKKKYSRYGCLVMLLNGDFNHDNTYIGSNQLPGYEKKKYIFKSKIRVHVDKICSAIDFSFQVYYLDDVNQQEFKEAKIRKRCFIKGENSCMKKSSITLKSTQSSKKLLHDLKVQKNQQ